MPSILGCKIFIGKDVDDLFNAWMEEHPSWKVTNITTSLITQGALDGNFEMVVMYVRETNILVPQFGGSTP